MRKYQFPALFVVLMSIAHPAHADGLIYKLPKDGTWATYQAESSASVEGEVLEQAKTVIRIASVGEVTENGLACRWIEYAVKSTESKVDEPGGEKRVRSHETVYKVLIPEKHLAQGEAPIDHIIRGWMRQGEKGRPRKIGNSDSRRKPLTLILSGPLKDARQLPKAEVESKLGRLLCEGVSGHLQTELPGDSMPRMVLEDRLHPDAPFGLVSSRGSFETELRKKVGNIEEGKVKASWSLVLSDFGDNATSKMPDAK